VGIYEQRIPTYIFVLSENLTTKALPWGDEPLSAIIKVLQTLP